ncbi:MAG: 1-deoxy-D-xylulose-5-phosphate reductoisomerase [Prevotellaceae bacterium]|nr:1-deoxy-D-xylulose-5-phosphate reductoisomerase [Prevotellaceae bacterium]
MKKQIVILGSTGSVGTQALEVIEEQSELFEVYAITANNSAELLVKQARKFNPEVVVIANKDKYPFVKDALQDLPIKVFAGAESVAAVAEMEPVDIVLTAMVGYAGLLPTIHALKAGKTIALANKETMVVAGDLVCDLSEKYKSAILPVDSEHSAIFQCLAGELSPIEKIILTASGGPFRGKDRRFLENVTPADALRHPNWSMGAKITIDSASMMNKGFEVIEAKWLFNVRPDQIVPVVHPQSLIHSMVQFEDGSVKAQMGLPDMKLPIQYAFTYPQRVKNTCPRIDFYKCKEITFEDPDMKVFRNLGFAFEALDKGGNMPCILNAANEVVVEAFLRERLGFLQMSDVIEQTMQKVSFVKKPSYEDYVATDADARKVAASLIS